MIDMNEYVYKSMAIRLPFTIGKDIAAIQHASYIAFRNQCDFSVPFNATSKRGTGCQVHSILADHVIVTENSEALRTSGPVVVRIF